MGFLYFIVYTATPQSRICASSPAAMGLPLPLGHDDVKSSKIITKHVHGKVCNDYDKILISQCVQVGRQFTWHKNRWSTYFRQASGLAGQIKVDALNLKKSDC